jgi:hypothetical protein
MFNDEPLPASIRYVGEFLDRILPLHNASHTEVVSYSVEIPMRYAKCFAILQDGRKVALQDSQLFVGWLGRNQRRSFLFRTNGLQVEIQTNSDHPASRSTPGYVCEVVVETIAGTGAESYLPSQEGQPSNRRKFIAIDGSQIVLSGRA